MFKNLFKTGIPKCNGLIFRLQNTCFIDKRLNYHEKKSLILQRNMSCGGCESCGIHKYKDDCFQEWVNESCGEFMIPNDIKDGDLVKLEFNASASDWEMPHIYDDIEYYFVKVNYEDLK